MVLRAKRAKNGRMMYFKDNKLISKARYLAARSRSSKTTKRSTARKPSKNGVKRMKKSLPHPSVTGMASGLAIAAYLNKGQTVSGTSLGVSGAGDIMTDGVIKDVTDGQLGAAFSTLSTNAINMIASDTGRKTLVTAGGIAALGAFARRQFPQLKLGGSKLYFRI
jgi:hypothetical protein|tara:strand:+ start:1130 stop:1624 length:495 start_codon:yes stop_codon:yes gene_type:complete